MPLRNCNKCHQRHAPPTGKKCQFQDNRETDTVNPLEKILEAIQEVKSDVSTISDRVTQLESPSAIIEEGAHGISPGRASEELNQRVSTRMADLHLLHDSESEEEDSEDGEKRPSRNPTSPALRRKGKKSGSARTAEDIVVRDIAWPHYPVYVGPTRRPAKYSDLTPEQFVFGYIRNMQREPKAVKTIMLNHLQDLMQDAMDYSWQNARSYHKLLLQQFEMDRLSWTDTEQIQEFRRIHAQRAPLAQSNHPGTTTGKPLYCAAFQKGNCQQTTDHNSTRGFVRHICANCLKVTKQSYPHAEIDCRRKQHQELSKNEEL